jgi:oxidase EvaA
LADREVTHWDQPLMASREEGRAILLCQEKDGVLHFLFNCRAEIGFRDRFEYGPTIQDADGDTFILPALQEKEIELKNIFNQSTVLISNLQSDEGGRFFRCTSRYSIRILDKDEVIDLDRSLSWFTLRQIESLAKRPGIFSNEARSLISMLLSHL